MDISTITANEKVVQKYIVVADTGINKKLEKCVNKTYLTFRASTSFKTEKPQ